MWDGCVLEHGSQNTLSWFYDWEHAAWIPCQEPVFRKIP